MEWNALLLLGAYHGINPGMGWLFAVALGMQQRSARGVWRALPPMALGHAAAVGTVVGAFTSGAIDSLFDSGADTLDDWGGAVVDGFEEVGETFSAIGEGVGDVFDSIF